MCYYKFIYSTILIVLYDELRRNNGIRNNFMCCDHFKSQNMITFMDRNHFLRIITMIIITMRIQDLCGFTEDE